MNFALLLAQNDDAAAAAGFFVVFLGIFCGAILVSLAIWAAICWFIIGCYKRIPEQYRLMPPNQVWLLLIPVFNIFWNFFVFLRLADSYKAYFNAQGDASVNDCGKQLALIYCISVCCLVIPYLNACIGIVSLVLLIIVLLKFNELKNRIPAAA